MWLSTLFALSNILALVYIKENTILKQADKFPFSAKAAYLQTGCGIQSAVFFYIFWFVDKKRV